MLAIRKSKLRNTLLIIVSYLLIGITSFLVFNYYIQKKRILTPLKVNTCVTEVSLSEGYLYFNNFKIEDEFSYSFEGEVYTISMKKKDYIEYLEKKPIPSSICKDLIDNTIEPQIIYYDSDKRLLSDDFTFSYCNENNTSSINICVSKHKLPYYLPLSNNVANNLIESKIESTKLKISYYKDNNNYYNYVAEFKYNGLGYVVHGKNINQQNFIEILFNILE